MKTKTLKVSGKHGVATFTFARPDTLEEAVKLWGEDGVLKAAIRHKVVEAQALYRPRDPEKSNGSDHTRNGVFAD